ncbi:antibiotic biosynthesis monooxygenase [Cellulosimicrobium protaetiae]|uniref:Antibiotic biosynthesis monooxygenase n=1 Tax=Cellulosimicrobium protaetiae TaxID=2587808 RepID=A0A6M5UKK3_9MICO|nr:antibiotic biosynthesis monooxygenase [Cellulosimicrobium protaetiae]QJW37865.1 antibiotic biosynthesis monooxygenase [Cellulosimicrobium protaetiae]
MTHDVPEGERRTGGDPARALPPELPARPDPRPPLAGTGPVTVAIERRVLPENVPAVTRWVQTGVNLANRYPGFLGSGWVRASAGSHDWHMLYRFADAATLDAWETSPDRVRWLAQGRGLVEETRVERRTGIEGWFDTPTTADAAPAGAPVAPPRWKQSVSIWLGFFPVNLAFTLLVGGLVPAWDDVPVVPRVLATTLVLTPVMTYLVLPRVTRLLAPWLARPPRTGRARVRPAARR